MPAPKPGANEPKEDFVSRCIKFFHDEDSDMTDEQIQAACYDAWDKAKEGREMKLHDDSLVERRSCRPAELRIIDDNGKKLIQGYIATYETLSYDLGGFKEKIGKDAFKRALNRKPDAFAFWNHKEDIPLGRMRAKTLELRADNVGLFAVIDPPSWAAGYMESIERGDADAASFGFITVADSWEHRKDVSVRTLEDMELVEVSVGVVFPAYPKTNIGIARRSLEESLKSTGKAEPTLAKPDEIVPAPTRWDDTGDILNDTKRYLKEVKDENG